jgi:cell division protein FtsB
MENENFKIQMIAVQALYDKYGLCPAPQQIKLLESDSQGTYILFRIGKHQYRFENGEVVNIEEQDKNAEATDFYFNMYRESEHEIELMKSKLEKLQKRNNEMRYEIHRLKDQIRKLEPVATALIGMIKED